MFGVGLQEMLVIAFVAVLVFGPDRLPDLARQAGRMARQVRSFAHSARDELRSELGPEYADLQLRDLDPRTIVRKHIMEAMNEPEDAPDAVEVQARPCARTRPRPTTWTRPDVAISRWWQFTLGALRRARRSAVYLPAGAFVIAIVLGLVLAWASLKSDGDDALTAIAAGYLTGVLGCGLFHVTALLIDAPF